MAYYLLVFICENFFFNFKFFKSHSHFCRLHHCSLIILDRNPTLPLLISGGKEGHKNIFSFIWALTYHTEATVGKAQVHFKQQFCHQRKRPQSAEVPEEDPQPLPMFS